MDVGEHHLSPAESEDSTTSNLGNAEDYDVGEEAESLGLVVFNIIFAVGI